MFGTISEIEKMEVSLKVEAENARPSGLLTSNVDFAIKLRPTRMRDMRNYDYKPGNYIISGSLSIPSFGEGIRQR